MGEKKKDVLQPVDEGARRQAKALVRTARYASLGTLDTGDGSPSVSRVSLATTIEGDPVFLISRLSGHFGNLEADRRCSLLVGEPGKGDPLAHPRMTLIGSGSIIDDGTRAHVKDRYLRRHPKAALYADFPDFAFWRLRAVRASLNAGFGKAYALAPADLAANSTAADLAEMESGAVAHMNADHAGAVDSYAAQAGANGTGWRLTGIDTEGLDLSRTDETARLWFERPLREASELRPMLVALAKRPG